VSIADEPRRAYEWCTLIQRATPDEERTMTDAKADLKAELAKSLELLRTLRDEAKVKLHLGGMDAKDRWNKLEPRIEDALGKAASEVTDASRTVVDETVRVLREFSASLHK
jgi:transposase